MNSEQSGQRATEIEPGTSSSRADPAFKRVTQDLAASVGLRLVGAELPQTLTADMVLEIPQEAQLEGTLFSFLAGYSYAVLDFKGQADTLDMDKFLVNVARTALFCSRRPGTRPVQVLNLIVSSRYPQDFLREAGAELVNSAERPWLWLGRSFYQEVAIVACRELPLEPLYYDWLAFAPADSEAWRALVRRLLSEGRRDLIDLVKSMRPKEYEAMKVSEVLADLDPQERRKLRGELAQVIRGELEEMAVEDEELFENLIEQALEIRKRKKQHKLKQTNPLPPTTDADEQKA